MTGPLSSRSRRPGLRRDRLVMGVSPMCKITMKAHSMLQCSRSQDALSPFGDKPTPSPSRSDPLHDTSHECTQAPAGCGVCPPEYASAPRTLKGQPASVNPYGHWLETNAWSRESAQQIGRAHV